MKAKGSPKTGGREKGTLNKQTAELRAFVSEIIYSNMEQVKKDIVKVEPEKRLALFEKLLSYVLPKPQGASFPLEDGLTRMIVGKKEYIHSKKDFE